MSGHGTRSRYVTGCRCESCCAANREYAKARPRAKAREEYVGGAFRVSPDVARRAIAQLVSMGWNRNEIARAAGVSKNSVNNIWNRRNKNGETLEYVTRDTIERLLALVREKKHAREGGQLVDSAPYREAVMAWREVFTFPELSELTGMSVNQLHNFVYHGTPSIRESTARVIRKAAPKVAEAFRMKKGYRPAPTWRERMAEREAAGFVVNPYR